MQGFDFSAGSAASPIMAFGSGISRLPDVALSHNPATSLANMVVHFAYAESGTTVDIIKENVDFGSLMLGTPIPSVEDVENLGSPMGSFWDDFTLRIDAPDHYTGAWPSNWAYTYFDDDNNKIKVRMRNQTLSPGYNTYVVNDGSMAIGGTSPAQYLDNITNAGNNFPSISYLDNGSGVYVAWYTNYDPMGPRHPSTNNPLYTYTTQTQGYVAIVMDDIGDIRTNTYNRVDNDFGSNRIGAFIDPANPYTNMYYPKICLSKNNEGNKLFAIFSSHDSKPNLIWNWPSSTFLAGYFEFSGAPTFFFPTIPQYSDIDYSTNPYSVGSGTSVFLSQKQVDWYPLVAPLFRKSHWNVAIEESSSPLKISGNPFSNTIFQLSGGNPNLQYTACLTASDGRIILQQEGTVGALNQKFKQLNIEALSSGIYILKMQNQQDPSNVFKLVKQ